MAPLERFRINYFLAVFIISGLLAACQQSKPEIIIPNNYKNISEEGFLRHNNILSFKNQPFSGWLFSLYQNGDTVFTTSFLEGKEQGCSRKWYPGKKPMEIRFYENGKQTGEHKGWWENGQLKFVSHYSNDAFEGNLREWNEKGTLYRDSNYKNGKEDGLQRLWRPNGTMYANYVVKNGRNYGLTGVKNCKNVADVIKE